MSPERNRGTKLSGNKPRRRQRAAGYAVLAAGLLVIGMAYAAITGILAWRRVRFADRRHRAFFTASLVYIAASVPLHVYCSYVTRDLSIYLWFPVWFSYLLLIAVYPAFLTMFWRLRYKD